MDNLQYFDAITGAPVAAYTVSLFNPYRGRCAAPRPFSITGAGLPFTLRSSLCRVLIPTFLFTAFEFYEIRMNTYRIKLLNGFVKGGT